MKCQLCEEEATVTYTKIVDNKSQKVFLCARCADEQGITNIDNFSLSDILMNDDKSDLASSPKSIDKSECSECGFTLKKLRKIGRLGCSACYDQFGKEVVSMIENMHKGSEHKGKVPEGMLKAIESKTKLNELEEELNAAIAEEDYERAGELKNELAEFRKNLALESK